MFRHPNYYKKLRASHVKEAISPKQSTDSGGRAPSDSTGGVPGNADITVTSHKRQAAGDKRQASGDKLQASSVKRQAKRQATSAVCHPNRQATGKAFRDDRL